MNLLIKVVLGAVTGFALVATSTVANADGIDGVEGRSASAFNWGGFYLGLSAGWQGTDIDGVVTNFTGGGAAPPNQNWNVDEESAIFGGIIGIQHQFGSFVLGVEANLSSGMRDRGSSHSPTADCVSAVGDRQCDAETGTLFTVGPRLGWAVGNTLFYGTGGYARARIESELLQDSTNNPLIRSESHHDGWFLGGGIDWAATNNAIIGIEYQRVHLDDESHRFVNSGNGLAGGERATFESDSDIIRARVTFKLDKECCDRPMK